ncbi:MAG: hypothetical protein F6K24_22195 [Okeania sp. SIO2D1]|nr:hypothetical protein [Okeania sp. SIO2D1]
MFHLQPLPNISPTPLLPYSPTPLLPYSPSNYTDATGFDIISSSFFPPDFPSRDGEGRGVG